MASRTPSTSSTHTSTRPSAHYSLARRSPSVLGMFLFIALGDHALRRVLHRVLLRPRRERRSQWPTPPFHLPVFVAFLNTCILVTSSFTMHWALQSIKRGNVFGLRAGLLLTFLMGLDVPDHAGRRVRADRLHTGRRRVRDDLLLPHRPARRARLRRADDPALHDDPRLPRALLAGAPSRRRDRRDLLALRRRNVDRRLHDRLHPLTCATRCAPRLTPFASSVVVDRLLGADRRSPRRGEHLARRRRLRRRCAGAICLVVLAPAVARRVPADRVAGDARRRAPDPRDRERDGRRPRAARRADPAAAGRDAGDPRRRPGAELAAAALGLGRGRRARRGARSGSTEPRASSRRPASTRAARSATAIRCRRSRMRCARSAPTRSSSRRIPIGRSHWLEQRHRRRGAASASRPDHPRRASTSRRGSAEHEDAPETVTRIASSPSPASAPRPGRAARAPASHECRRSRTERSPSARRRGSARPTADDACDARVATPPSRRHDGCATSIPASTPRAARREDVLHASCHVRACTSAIAAASLESRAPRPHGATCRRSPRRTSRRPGSAASVSLPLNAGMTPPPTSTWCCTDRRSGLQLIEVRADRARRVRGLQRVAARALRLEDRLAVVAERRRRLRRRRLPAPRLRRRRPRRPGRPGR